MSPRSEYRACFAGFMATGLVLALLTLYVEQGYVAGFFANVLIWSWKLRQPACAHCETPLAPPLGSSFHEIVESFRRRDCSCCGRRVDVE